jgi:hypothetical protein
MNESDSNGRQRKRGIKTIPIHFLDIRRWINGVKITNIIKLYINQKW